MHRKKLMEKKKVLFLCSGNGGSMIFVDQASKNINSPFEVIGAISDRDCKAIDYCRKQDLNSFVFKPWKEMTIPIVNTIRDLNPDVVVTNISKILPKEILQCCNVPFINLHWSLLPAFGGVIGFKTIELAKLKKTRIIGATCHYVTEELDGGPIIAQGAIPVDWEDDFDTISRDVFRTACKVLLNGIYIVLNVSQKHTSSDGFLYSPLLSFDDSFMDYSFWRTTF